MKCPCKNCEERHRACHDNCERFKEWKAEYAAQQEYLKKHKGNPHLENLEKNKSKIRKNSTRFRDTKWW